jgi:MFS superfamily sulfate permease-like transporter
MSIINRRAKFYFLSFLKHDFKASITVFFVALPLCLGISLASGAPVYSGLLAGILGGLVVGAISRSHISVSGPAAGLTAICASAITELGTIEIFFSVSCRCRSYTNIAGYLQIRRLYSFYPSTVIKGMLAAIGIILISKQIPLLMGYDKADFWTKELFNVISFRNAFEHVKNIYYHSSMGAVVIALSSLALLIVWKRTMAKRISFIPTSFVVVLFGILMALLFKEFVPALALKSSQFVNVPGNLFSQIKLPDYSSLFSNPAILKNALSFALLLHLKLY